MNERIYKISERHVGDRRRPGEIKGWMAFAEGFGSPHGLRPYRFSQWAKETFAKTKRGALKYFRRDWSGWVLVAVKPVRLVKAQLGPNEPVNGDTMVEFPIRLRSLRL
jgi:hypothetical protein